MRTTVTPELPCRRCGGDLYLTPVAPHPTMPGVMPLVLCPQCDAHDPAAQPLLACSRSTARPLLA